MNLSSNGRGQLIPMNSKIRMNLKNIACRNQKKASLLLNRVTGSKIYLIR